MTRKAFFITAAIFLGIAILVPWGIYMTTLRYQMAVLVDEPDPDAPEWPGKRKWFSAREWLATDHYIKVNDFYLINKKFEPIKDLNSLNRISARLILQIQKAIDGKGNYSFPELNHLIGMDFQPFFKLIVHSLAWEYVYSEFDNNTLQPDIDSFLINFSYKDKEYEVFMKRRIINGDSFFTSTPFWLYKRGDWQRSHNLMTYTDYLQSFTH